MAGTPRTVFRPDIEGLRAVAVLLVVLFHAGLPLSGGFVGVDVFFVISGFLITGLLLREVETSGTIRFVDFYARRARRLLPAGVAVLLVCAGLTGFLAPATRRPTFGSDVIAAAAFTTNWRFAARSVDYWAADLGRSPVLHFWSLSVEEQFYVLWPGLIALAAYAARRVRRAPREVVALALVLTVLLSLFFSVELTAAVGAQAFFSTGARIWELGIGAILALVLQSPPALLARFGFPAAFLGLVLIGFSAVHWAPKADWPGWRALVPTVGTALVIAGGTMSPTNAASRVYARSLAPMLTAKLAVAAADEPRWR